MNLNAILLTCFLLLLHCADSLNSQSVNPASRLLVSQKNADLLNKLAAYPGLQVLSIECVESLRALPESIGKLRNLRELRIDNGNGCAMNPTLPESIGNLQSLGTLVLYGAQDPRHMDDPQLKKRHPFPNSMSRLQNLTVLDLGRNGLAEVPVFVNDLSKIIEFDFQWNDLKTLPAFLVQLRELRTLKLDGNSLTDLPSFLSKLPKLSRITVGNNCEITQNPGKVEALKRRFPKIKIDFTDEYDCPAR